MSTKKQTGKYELKKNKIIEKPTSGYPIGHTYTSSHGCELVPFGDRTFLFLFFLADVKIVTTTEPCRRQETPTPPAVVKLLHALQTKSWPELPQLIYALVLATWFVAMRQRSCYQRKHTRDCTQSKTRRCNRFPNRRECRDFPTFHPFGWERRVDLFCGRSLADNSSRRRKSEPSGKTGGLFGVP